MKWVVGTGRCGMHNYTALHDGYINSSAEWKEQGLLRYHGKEWDRGLVESVVKKRMVMPYGCVTDCSQFIFLDIIKKLDKNAKFVWLIADKQKCIEGFMSKVGEDKRIHPEGWDFAYKNKRQLLSWYYDEVNNIIKEHLYGTNHEIVHSDNLEKAPIEKIEKLKEFA